MKRMVLTTILVATGSMVLAQQGPGAGAPAAGGSLAIAPVPAPGATSATNAVSGKLDFAKMQAIYAELNAIGKELQPREKELQADDPDLKAVADKQVAERQVMNGLETQRRELMDKKLSADPKIAPLVARRHELQQTLREMRPAALPMGAARENQMNYGPRRMPQQGNGPVRSDAAPKVVPAPATVPDAEKTPGQPK